MYAYIGPHISIRLGGLGGGGGGGAPIVMMWSCSKTRSKSGCMVRTCQGMVPHLQDVKTSVIEPRAARQWSPRNPTRETGPRGCCLPCTGASRCHRSRDSMLILLSNLPTYTHLPAYHLPTHTPAYLPTHRPTHLPPPPSPHPTPAVLPSYIRRIPTCLYLRLPTPRECCRCFKPYKPYKVLYNRISYKTQEARYIYIYIYIYMPHKPYLNL